MASIVDYKIDLINDFKYVALKLGGEISPSGEPRPEYTASDLSPYLNTVQTTIPKIRTSGNPSEFFILEAAVKNADTLKGKINAKRLEALCGSRVDKAASALSFYYKMATDPKSIPDMLFTELLP